MTLIDVGVALYAIGFIIFLISFSRRIVGIIKSNDPGETKSIISDLVHADVPIPVITTVMVFVVVLASLLWPARVIHKVLTK